MMNAIAEPQRLAPETEALAVLPRAEAELIPHENESAALDAERASEQVLPTGAATNTGSTASVLSTRVMSNTQPANPSRAPRRVQAAQSLAVDDEGTFAGWLLDISASSSLMTSKRALAGAGLAALFGASVGAHDGALGMLMHALGAPLGILAVTLVGVPALFIAMSLADAEITPAHVARLTARGWGRTGLVLAGLAPVTALYMVTVMDAGAHGFVAGTAMTLGGLVGIAAFAHDMFSATRESSSSARFVSLGLVCGFSVFALVLAVRTYSAVMPVFGGAL